MDPEIEIGVERNRADAAAARQLPSVLMRLMEVVGLGLVIYSLATSVFWLALVGVGLIVGSYAIYRRKAGPASPKGPDQGPDGADADGGGD